MLKLYFSIQLDQAYETYSNCSTNKLLSLSVMTFNIRGEDLDLSSPVNNWWTSRGKRASFMLSKYLPSFLGLQEGSVRQISDFVQVVNIFRRDSVEYKVSGHKDAYVPFFSLTDHF